jgi:hypothetical protein
LFFLFLWKTTLEFWWRLHWTCKQPFSPYWLCQSMNMGGLSIFRCLLQFLSSSFYSYYKCVHLLRFISRYLIF